MPIKTTIDLESILKDTPSDRLSSVIDELHDVSFDTYFKELLDQYKKTNVDIIQKTTIQRNYAYQILNGTKTNPGRDKILQFILALGCSLDEANRLLTLSHCEKLYAKNKRDALLLHSLVHHYSVIEVNEKLNEYHFEILE